MKGVLGDYRLPCAITFTCRKCSQCNPPLPPTCRLAAKMTMSASTPRAVCCSRSSSAPRLPSSYEWWSLFSTASAAEDVELGSWSRRTIFFDLKVKTFIPTTPTPREAGNVNPPSPPPPHFLGFYVLSFKMWTGWWQSLIVLMLSCVVERENKFSFLLATNSFYICVLAAGKFKSVSNFLWRESKEMSLVSQGRLAELKCVNLVVYGWM